MPFEIHCTIVKTSKQRKSRGRSIYIAEHNIQESGVFNNPENYEIELEFIDDKLEEFVTKKYHADERAASSVEIFKKTVMGIIKKYTKIIFKLKNCSFIY